jgi:uncharacterized protein
MAYNRIVINVNVNDTEHPWSSGSSTVAEPSTSSGQPVMVALSAKEMALVNTMRTAETTMSKVASNPSYVPDFAMAPAPGIHGPFFQASEEASTTLFDMAKLHIPREHQGFFGRVMKVAQKIMSQNDGSHNWEHIQRVVAIALRLDEAEMPWYPEDHFDPTKLFLAMIVHDVGDKNYLKEGETEEQKTKDCLKAGGTPSQLIEDIWVIANGVSYTAERRNPQIVLDLINQHPELAIVQDADRLDGLGFVGIARCFAYGGHNARRKQGSFDKGVQHIFERFINYLPLMKTHAGKEEACARWPEMELFWKRYRAEADVSSVLPSPAAT